MLLLACVLPLLLFADIASLARHDEVLDIHPLAKHICVTFPESSPVKFLHQADYFNKPVPKILHQIWFGDREGRDRFNDLNTSQKWIESCEKFGWKYILWTEKDIDHVAEFASPGNICLLKDFLQKKGYLLASDVMRYELLRHYGGVYMDCDFQPPTRNGEYVSLFDLFPSRGSTFMLDHQLWPGGNAGVSACNGFLFSPKEGPLITELCSQLVRNCQVARNETDDNAHCCTGPFYLNKLFSGCFNAVSPLYPEEHMMFIPRRTNPVPPSPAAYDIPQTCETEAKTEANPLMLNTAGKMKYFEAPVPRIVHQLWIGPAPHPPTLEKTQQKWKEYCEQHGYTYMLWTENSPGIRELLAAKNYALFHFLHREGHPKAASDVLKYAALLEHGGFYVDCDVLPPSSEGMFLPMEKLFPCKGILLPTSHLHRNTGSFSAVYVSTKMLFAARGHPLIKKAVNNVFDNFQAYRSVRTDMDRNFLTGRDFLSRILAGCWTLVHPNYLKELNMTVAARSS